MCTLTTDLNAYGYSTDLRVRLSETDAVGIVFFGSFASYFDVGRMDYLNHLELNKFDGAIKDLIPGAVVHQEAHFHKPAHYNDQLTLHVRIAKIGNSSYTFHFLVVNRGNRDIIATGQLTLVWLDSQFQSITIPALFRNTVKEFEGASLTERS